MTNITYTQNWRVSNSDMDSSRNAIHTTGFNFYIWPPKRVALFETSNYQLLLDQPVNKLWTSIGVLDNRWTFDLHRFPQKSGFGHMQKPQKFTDAVIRRHFATVTTKSQVSTLPSLFRPMDSLSYTKPAAERKIHLQAHPSQIRSRTFNDVQHLIM